MDHFYFVRHGETVWNVENKICGATDIELTEKGHEQAIETGKKIRELGSGKLSITLDSENAEPVGEISFAGADDGFALYETEVNIPDGIHGLFFGFSGEGKIDFKSFTFE